MNHTKLYTCAADFKQGEVTNLMLDDTIANGALVLCDGAAEGSFVSDVFSLDPFTEAVMSWNVDAPEGSYVELLARAKVGDVWSEWLTWGAWAPFIRRTSKSGKGGVADMSCDTLEVVDAPEKYATQCQLRCDFYREADAGSPALRLLGITSRMSAQDRLRHTMGAIEIDNPAPAYSQLNRDPNIASRMCSGVTVTVLLNALGDDLLPEEVALVNWDEEYGGIGNWSFSVATAGAYGHFAYVEMTDVDGLKNLLLEGYPVGVGASYSDTQERATQRAPYLENAPGFTSGHLLTIRGMTTVGDREYVLVNDSYGTPDSNAVRQYPLEQFMHAWKGVVYVVREKQDGAGFAAPYRVPAKLVKTDFGDEWRLSVKGREIPLPAGFHGSRNGACRGAIAYTVSDGREYGTEANREVSYTKVTTNGNVFLPAKQLLNRSPMGDRAKLSVYIITDRGVTYTATLTKADL